MMSISVLTFISLLTLLVNPIAARPTNCSVTTGKHRNVTHHFHPGAQHSHSGSPLHTVSVVINPSSSSAIPTSSATVVAAAAISSSTPDATTSSSTSPAAVSSPVTNAALVTTDTSTGEYTPDQYVSLHTAFRATYGAGAVTWNDTLQAYAKAAADKCVFAHTGGPYGENLAAGAGGGYTVTSGFDSWANEASSYNWNNPGFAESTGHFTQLVWKATSQIGCAMTQCADGTIFTGYGQSEYIVCEYYPAGNIVGDNNAYFIANVGTYTG